MTDEGPLKPIIEIVGPGGVHAEYQDSMLGTGWYVEVNAEIGGARVKLSHTEDTLQAACDWILAKLRETQGS